MFGILWKTFVNYSHEIQPSKPTGTYKITSNLRWYMKWSYGGWTCYNAAPYDKNTCVRQQHSSAWSAEINTGVDGLLLSRPADMQCKNEFGKGASSGGNSECKWQEPLWSVRDMLQTEHCHSTDGQTSKCLYISWMLCQGVIKGTTASLGYVC